MSSLVDKMTNEQFANLIKDSFSIAEVAKKIGYKSKGGGVVKLIKNKIIELDLDTTHFNKYSKASSTKRNRPLEEILVENSDYTNNNSLKKRLLEEDLLKYECYQCHISEWNNKPLSLQLDHINGNNTDNRLENLRLLCPNCHSQTDTFSGRNASH